MAEKRTLTLGENIMDTEDIEIRIEVLEAGIVEQENLIKKFEEDEYDNHANHASNIRQAREEIRQLEMEIEDLKYRLDSEDFYED